MNHARFVARASIVASAAWALTQANAQAASIVANATYSYDGNPATALVDSTVTSGLTSADVLNFSGSATTPSNTGLHTYGNQYGNIGSRSSGAGVYDVTGHLVYTDVITNTTGTAQNAVFNFSITPGAVQTDIQSVLGANEFVKAGVFFDIRSNGNSVWGSSLTLQTSATGTTHTLTGTDIYTPASSGSTPTTYTIAGGLYAVDLGVLNAGQSITLTYELNSFASGNSVPNGQTYTTPTQTVDVPNQMVQGLDCVIPTLAQAQIIAVPGGCVRNIGGFSAVVGGTTITNGVSGSHASSGDPFGVDLNGAVYNTVGTFANTTGGPNVVLTAVPEPESAALVLVGLAGLGFCVKRQRRAV